MVIREIWQSSYHKSTELSQWFDSHDPPAADVHFQTLNEPLHRRAQTPEELGRLAEELANANDAATIVRLKSALTRGFYAE